MKRYLAIFKCRLCGETFIAKEALNRKLAEAGAMFAAMGSTSSPSAPTLNDIHICEDGSVGISDFIGYKEKGEDTDA